MYLGCIWEFLKQQLVKQHAHGAGYIVDTCHDVRSWNAGRRRRWTGEGIGMAEGAVAPMRW